MDLPITKHLLQFDPIVQLIEQGFALLPPHIAYPLSVEQYVMYLLEWLSVKMEDAESETAADLGIAYLVKHHVPAQFAKEMSHAVLNEMLELVVGTFPNITYREMALAKYNWDGRFTLVVQLPMRALCVNS